MAVSFILNGLILLTSLMTVELRTSANVVTIHLSLIGFLVPIVYSPSSLAAFLDVTLSCDCNVLYYQWLFGQVLFSGVYPLNILLLTINYLLIIKFTSKSVTYLRASIGLGIIWGISFLFNLPTVFLTPPRDYIDCCETVCRNGSAVCNTSNTQQFTPRLFNDIGSQYYNFRDITMIVVPSAIVFSTSAASYYIYRKLSVKTSFGLELRMLLLPVIMTTVSSVHLLAQDCIDWRPTHTTNEEFPGVMVYISLHILWDTNGVLYAVMILFFNVTLRRKCIDFVSATLFRRKNIKEKSRSALSIANVWLLLIFIFVIIIHSISKLCMQLINWELGTTVWQEITMLYIINHI